MATLFILFATHLVGGVAAFGSTLLALPLMLPAGWELRPAVALLIVVGLVQSLQVSCLTWRDVDRKALARILIVAGAGLPIGFFLAGWLPGKVLGAFLGLLLIAAGVVHVLDRAGQAASRPPAWALGILLLLGGVMHGAFGTGGATLTIYGQYALPDKDAFRGTLSVMWSVLNAAVLAGLVLEGLPAGPLAAALPTAIPAVLLATWLGHRAARWLPQRHFARLVAALQCGAGVLTLVRNIG